MSLPNEQLPEGQSPDPAIDPYYLWTGLEPHTPLPFERVRDGLASFIAYQLDSLWRMHTKVAHEYYHSRRSGLRAWSKYVAYRRLMYQPRESYTAEQFHELAFSEAVREGGVKAMRDPAWRDLIDYKLDVGDIKFFEHFRLLVNQAGIWSHRAMQTYAIYWDVLIIPGEFWVSSALANYLCDHLRQTDITSAAVRQWAHRLELQPSPYPVVTEYDARTKKPEYIDENIVRHGIIWEKPNL